PGDAVKGHLAACAGIVLSFWHPVTLSPCHHAGVPMQLCKVQTENGETRVGVVIDEHVHYHDGGDDVGLTALSDVLHADHPLTAAQDLIDASTRRESLRDATLLAPVDRQEVWAAGVTYQRSREARERESVGAAHFYDLVYKAARPELFFKATPHRVAGPG